MKKTTKKSKKKVVLTDWFGNIIEPQVLKSIPLKKHLLKKFRDLKKETFILEQKRHEFWDQVTKSVKARRDQMISINIEKSSVEFYEY